MPEPLEDLSAAVITPGGSFLVADQKRKRVYRFDAQLEAPGTFPDAREREVTGMLVDGEGGIVMLDREEKTVRVFDEAGRPLRAVAARGPGYELRRPVDMAVDADAQHVRGRRGGGRAAVLAAGPAAGDARLRGAAQARRR